MVEIVDIICYAYVVEYALDMIMLRMHRIHHIITFMALNVKSCYGTKPGRYTDFGYVL